MGMSVFNQVDSKSYFSLSTINIKELRKRGIELPLSKFKDIVKKSTPHTTIMTGSARTMGNRRATNIYRYDDFNYLAAQ